MDMDDWLATMWAPAVAVTWAAADAELRAQRRDKQAGLADSQPGDEPDANFIYVGQP